MDGRRQCFFAKKSKYGPIQPTIKEVKQNSLFIADLKLLYKEIIGECIDRILVPDKKESEMFESDIRMKTRSTRMKLNGC